HTLLQGDDRVVRDRDVFRTNLCATFRDVAITDPLRLRELLDPVLCVQRMHFERCDVHEISGTNELLVQMMFSQDVAHVLTKETLDALSEFLNAINILLRHSPGSFGRIRLAWVELFDLFLYTEIP